jgi:hypothetical protein
MKPVSAVCGWVPALSEPAGRLLRQQKFRVARASRGGPRAGSTRCDSRSGGSAIPWFRLQSVVLYLFDSPNLSASARFTIRSALPLPSHGPSAPHPEALRSPSLPANACCESKRSPASVRLAGERVRCTSAARCGACAGGGVKGGWDGHTPWVCTIAAPVRRLDAVRVPGWSVTDIRVRNKVRGSCAAPSSSSC